MTVGLTIEIEEDLEVLVDDGTKNPLTVRARKIDGYGFEVDGQYRV